MRRKPLSGKRYRRKFQKAFNKTKAINSPSFVMRGGTRL